MLDLSTVTTGCNLKTLAAIELAKFLWLEPEGDETCTRNFERWSEKDWLSVTQELVETILNRSLPKGIAIYLIEVVKTIGKRLYKWAHYATGALGFDYEGYVIPQPGYGDFLSWTHYGTIDEPEMFDYYNNQDMYEFEKHHRFGLNEFGCAVANIDYMKSYARCLRGTMKECFQDNFQFKHHRHYTLLACSLLYVGKAGPLTGQIKNRYNPMNKSKEELMFSLCAKDGYNFAIKYYWEKMSRKQRKENLIPAAIDAIKKNPTKNGDKSKEDEFDFEKYVFILSFLFSKMSEEQKNTFLVNYEYSSKMLITLASSWPWQEYFVPLFQEIKNSLPTKQSIEVLIALADLMLKEVPLGYDINQSLYYGYFEMVLKNLKKKNYSKNCSPNLVKKLEKMLSRLYDLMLIPFLKEILNDPNLKEHREDFLNAGKKNFLALLEDMNNFGKLQNFEKEVLRTNEERKQFKLNLNIWNELILKDKYAEVDKILSWQANSPKELQALKGQINSIGIWEELMKKNDFEAAEKFLLWRYPSTKGRSELINQFKTDEFCRKKFFEIWSSIDVKNAKDKCTKFFILMFQTEKNVNKFVKEKIYNDELLEKFCDEICSTKKLANVSLIKDLLQFCRMTQKDYNNLKLKMARDVNQWIKKYADEKDFFELSDSLLKWVFPDDGKKKAAIRNFLSTPEGIALSVKMFEKHYGTNSAFRTFTKSWVIPAGPSIAKKIKEAVKYELEDEIKEDYLSCMEDALDDLIKGKELSEYTLGYIEEAKEERRWEKKNRRRGMGGSGGFGGFRGIFGLFGGRQSSSSDDSSDPGSDIDEDESSEENIPDSSEEESDEESNLESCEEVSD